MDIEFHADIYSDEAIVRYRVAKDSHDGDEINLKQVERIDDITGTQVLYLPTCACGCIVESWSMLDRRVYDALVNAGMLQAKIYEIEVELNGSYSRPPTVTFECEVTGSTDIVTALLNSIIRFRGPSKTPAATTSEAREGQASSDAATAWPSLYANLMQFPVDGISNL